LTADRSKLPESGLARPFTFPSIEKSEAAGGVGLWTVRHAAIPVVTLMLLIRRGAADDPPGKEGLAALTVDMLDEGSGGRSAIEFHEALARIGAQIDSDVGSDASALTLTVLTRFVGEALTLIADMVARPSLADADFERVRQLRLQRLIQLRDMPSVLADRAFVKLLYGDHPYGHTPLGSEESVSRLTLEDVRAFRECAIRPSEATLIAVGDCTSAELEPLVSTHFAVWRGAATLPRAACGPVPDPARLNIVPRAGAPQSELRIGHVSVPRSTPDYHALVAANMVLGGQFVSRVNLKLREEKGFTYGARTSFEFRRLPGPFVFQSSVQTEATGPAIRDALDEIAAVRGPRAVTPTELELALAALTRGYARNFETAEQVARAVAQIALYDLADDYFAEFVPRMSRVTPDEVTRVAHEHLDPSRLMTVIVGDVDRVRPGLSAVDLGEEAIVPV
jgi:zinc protease